MAKISKKKKSDSPEEFTKLGRVIREIGLKRILKKRNERN